MVAEHPTKKLEIEVYPQLFDDGERNFAVLTLYPYEEEWKLAAEMFANKSIGPLEFYFPLDELIDVALDTYKEETGDPDHVYSMYRSSKDEIDEYRKDLLAMVAKIDQIRWCVEPWDLKTDTPIGEVPVATQTAKTLEAYGIRTVADLLPYTQQQLVDQFKLTDEEMEKMDEVFTGSQLEAKFIED